MLNTGIVSSPTMAVVSQLPSPPPPPVLPTSPAPELCSDGWCRPADGKGGACPTFNLQAKYDRQTIAKYLLLGLPSNYDDSSSQKLCYPSLEHLSLPPYSIPIPFLPNDGVGLPLCDAVVGRESSNPGAVCGFRWQRACSYTPVRVGRRH